MDNKNMPSNNDLPSMGRLIKSTILAICLAALILVTVVLPAEYGLDPTGVGSFIGLVKMGEIKVSLAQEAAADRAIIEIPESKSTSNATPASESVAEAASPESAESAAAVATDEMTVTLNPDEGKEIKLTMKEGAKVTYVGWTDGGSANFDAHDD